MNQPFTIPLIISYGDISTYLAANEKSSLDQLRSGSLIGSLSGILYMENTLLKNIHNLNPGSPTERPTAEYVLSLCGKYGVQAQNIINGLGVGLPVLTGPTNQSVNVGQTATFSVSVTGTGPFTYAWFLNGVAIPWATSSSYNKVNAQLSDSGGNFSVQVTNSAGSVMSASATLTVTASILLSAFYTDTDPRPALLANTDTFAYQFTVNVTHNQPISIPIPSAGSNNKFWVWRVASSEQDNNTWFSTALDSGTIPDSVFEDIIKFGGNSYYSLRNAASFDFTVPLVLSKV